MTYSDRAAAIRADIAGLAADADQALDAATALHNSDSLAIDILKASAMHDAMLLDELRTQSAADVQTIAGLRAQVADLKAKLAAATPPPVVTPPPVTTTTRPLAWAPPTLTDPLTIDLTPTNRKAVISGDRDAVVRIPAALSNVAGGIEIIGGRNVRLVGGEIRYDSVDVGRALYLKGVAGGLAGTVHVEGLLFSGTSIAGDAIDIDCQGQQRIVQLLNVDVALGLAGSYATNHSDAVQTWNGPNLLRIDGMVIRRPAYQGFMLDPKKFQTTLAAPTVDLRNVHVIQSDTPGYALYNASASVTGSNVKVRTGAVTNRVGYPSGYGVVAYGGTPLPDEQFLSGKPGIGYVSPGYA